MRGHEMSRFGLCCIRYNQILRGLGEHILYDGSRETLDRGLMKVNFSSLAQYSSFFRRLQQHLSPIGSLLLHTLIPE